MPRIARDVCVKDAGGLSRMFSHKSDIPIAPGTLASLRQNLKLNDFLSSWMNGLWELNQNSMHSVAEHFRREGIDIQRELLILYRKLAPQAAGEAGSLSFLPTCRAKHGEFIVHCYARGLAMTLVRHPVGFLGNSSSSF